MSSTPAALAAFERVAESIRTDIRTGVLKPGDKLPGNRDLAKLHNVALATGQRALQLLQDEGWVTARQSVGVFVNELPDSSESTTLEAVNRRVTELQAVVDDLVKRVQGIEDEHGAT